MIIWKYLDMLILNMFRLTQSKVFTAVKLFGTSCFRTETFSSTVNFSGPLEGIRIVDITRIVNGPYCTMILGDLGAEVLKIERPGTGDEARNWGPPFVEGTKESCYFLSVNRNKKSICIDIKTKEGRDIIYELVKKSDVLVENYVPGKLDDMGLGYDDIKVIAPHLIYCSLTGYGPKGPYSKRPGYDVIASSVGGLLHITGPLGGEPCKVGVAMVDLACGLYAHGAILAALFQRAKTNRGQKIDVDLLSTTVSSLINVGSNYLNAGQEAKRLGTQHGSIVPYQTFETSDKCYITVGGGSDKQFEALCEKLQLKELYEDPKFTTNKMRVQNRDILIEKLSKRFKEKNMSEWLQILEGSPFPYGPVNSMAQVFSDRHVQEIELVKEVTLAGGKTVKVVGPPVGYSEAQNCVRLPPPILGQHTSEVLKTILDYSDEKIEDLKSRNVVQ